jgi:Xaa-Pro aminopeptidase
MPQNAQPIGLTSEGCRERQNLFAKRLAAAGYDAAILSDRGSVHYFSGLWIREVFRSFLAIRADGQTTLAVISKPTIAPFVDQVVEYPGARLGTLVDDPFECAVQSLEPYFKDVRRFCTDTETGMSAELIRVQRRKKLPDEIALIEHAVHACEAIYANARKTLRPGLSEWTLYVNSLSVAGEYVGEPVGELGNDFQSGSIGGPPRHRPMIEGELLPLDVSVVVRGYHSDLCRTFAVDGHPSALQKEAHRRVAEVLDFAAATIKPGTSCRKLYEEAARMLKGYRGWDFPHHLGHGIGLSSHESPRLNPNWDDHFAEGDVFTVEPGLYSPELSGGVRLEQDFIVTQTGVRCLSTFPLEL